MTGHKNQRNTILFPRKKSFEKKYTENAILTPFLLARLAQKSLKQLSPISFFNFLIVTLRTDFFEFIILLFFTTGTITFSIGRF